MKKKLLLFSDPHITTKAEFSKPTDDGMTEYLHRVKDSFGWINDLVIDIAPDIVACLGDLFETRGHVDTTSLKLATKSVESLYDTCGAVGSQLIFLVGNHDTYSEQHRIHNLEFLKPILTLGAVVDEPRWFEDWLYLVPWTENISGVSIPKDAVVCFTHMDICGGWLSDNKKCDFGVDPSSITTITLNGHQHMPCMVTPKICNVGSLLSRSFSDSGGSVPRGVTVATIDLDNPQKWSIVRFPNPHNRPYVTLQIVDEYDAELWEENPDGYENSYLKIKCTSATRDVAEIVGSLSAGARIEEIPSEPIDEEVEVSETFSPEENLKKAVEEVMIFDHESDRARILEYGCQAIRECKESRQSSASVPINFIQVCIENFQSIEHMQLDLNNRGLVFVGGNNGAGKSTIVEAIFWAITGRSLRGYVGNEVINWGQKSCRVWVEFTVNYKPYTVERTRHPNKVRLWADEEEISCRISKDTDEVISGLVGRSKAVLQHSVFMTADLQVRFTGLQYPERIRLIEQVTDANIYSDVYNFVSKKYKESVSTITRAEGALSQAESDIESLADRKAKIDGKLVDAARFQKSTMKKLKQELTRSIERQGILDVEIEQINKMLSDVGTERGKVARSVRDATKLVTEKENSYTKYWEQKEYIRRRYVDLKADIDNMVCNFCGQAIEDNAPIISVSHKLKDELHRVIREVERAAEDRKSARQAEEDRLAELQDVSDELDKLGDVLFHKDSELKDVVREIGSIKVELQSNRTVLGGLKAARNEIVEQTETANAVVDDLTDKISNYKRDSYAWEWLVNAFSTRGIRAKVLSSVTLPYLNSRVEHYSGLFGLHCKITNRVESKGGKTEDKLDVVLAGKMTYRGCSRGQRRMIDLSIQKAFNDLATKTGGYINLLVGDEIIDPLDDENAKIFIEMLKQESCNKTILLMTHKGFTGELADHCIYLTNADGETVEAEKHVR